MSIDLSSVILLDHVISKIALLLFLLVVLKFISKRLSKTGVSALKTFDKFFMKIHLPIGFAMIALALIHGVLSIYSIETVGWLPFVLGIVCMASCLIAVGSFYLRKKMNKSKHWLPVHQISTIIAFVTLIGHIVLAKNPEIFLV
ncbi:hypothetical protein [Methanimicrococcus blatticola]|uniref:Ferric reductase like protein n=1 Tax=Methanimicrococcus blatticola TaxID=91560 RepID=A0A484F6B5_9EURY|nr:hypothetical protein [Methanimicrococcus blatticola]MBZ3935616.1 hypothetical protein [Methanimicrococcus blatticola]MCC2509257.1 hypothetical protein [Methanimicrococcus blatticola]TDQ69378.1 hypothetical protein C7391_0703 [Methanimicrococcus blatticola]